jgi:hypothetical protein
MVHNHNSTNASNRIKGVDGWHSFRSATASVVDDSGFASLQAKVFVHFDAGIAARDDDESSFTSCLGLLADVCQERGSEATRESSGLLG